MADTPKIVGVRISAAIARGLEIARRFALWAFADDPAEKESSKAIEPRRLSLADQWAFLTDTVMGAVSRTNEASRCHAVATQQIDLAQYALMSLVDELSAVMDMGDRVRRRATVHVLSVAPTPSLRPIGGAIAA
jgi:hypothetical protein